MSFNYVVIGAGPAGLAFASTVDNPSVLVVDAGKPVEERDRFNPQECIEGAGGAGLFSDGKFSFYPSGTKIWEQNPQRLREGYKMLTHDLASFKEIPPFPEMNSQDKLQKDQRGWCLKPYESVYLSFEDRMALVHTMARRCARIQYQTEFVGFSPSKTGYNIQLKNRKTGQLETVHAQKIVWAGGRFMPTFLKCDKVFRRYEFGFRVEGPAEIIKKEVKLIDPKYVFSENGVEYRTFCWCDNGEVVQTSCKGITTYSGRADCKPTGRSNFGFNIRVKDASLLAESDFQKVIHAKPFRGKLQDLHKVTDTLPDSAKKLIDNGVAKLMERFPGLKSDEVNIIGPTVEGVGAYPRLNEDFSLEGHPNISVIGDCNGTFRGIVASMMSGYIVSLLQKKGE